VIGMLDHGRAAARAAGLTNISWVHGDSTRLTELVEPGSQVATFAACFHWTDRAKTVEALDALLARSGSVVVIDDDLDDAQRPDWDRAIGEVRSHYPGLDPAPGAVSRLAERHREVLERSAFAHVEALTWSWTRQLDLEQVVGLQLTYSFSTPARLGDRLDEFCSEIRDAVLTLHPSGIVREPFRVEVLIASRP
jgi:hypothetical protein